MVRRENRAFGVHCNAGRERVNKSEIAGHVADRTRIAWSAAGDAVDAVFEAIGEALARGEDVRIVGFRTLRHQEPPRPHGAQSEDRREPEHRRLDRTDIEGRQAVAGCRQRGRVVMGMTGDRGQAGTGGAAC